MLMNRRTLQNMLGAAVLLLLTLTAGTAMAQSIGLVWTTPIPVANGAVYDNIRPQIALATGETPLVIWGSTTGGRKGWTTRWNGSAFATPTQVNPNGQINAYTVEGPNIAALGDTAYAVYTIYPANSAQVMLRSSWDGGLTWNAPVWVDSLGTDLPTFANLGITDSGQPIVMYIRQTATYADPRFVVRTSMDGGQTWSPEAIASDAAPGDDVCDCCTGQPYWHDGKLIATFRNNDANVRDMWAAISTDGGLTFPTAIDLDTTDWQIPACPSSGPVSLLIGDTIYTAFMSQGGNGLARVYLGASNLATGQLAYNWPLLDTSASISQNYVAIAGNGDTIAVAWYQNNGANPEIALRYSFTGVAGLYDHPIQYVTGWATGVQSFPDMVWSNGKLHLVWQDDATGTVKYSCGSVGILAGADEAGAAWQVFPNPTDGRFSITGLPVGEYALEVSDALGHLVYVQQLVAPMVDLDMRDLTTGMYFIRLRQAGAPPTTKRLWVQH
jgi:hypothetical protein